MQTLQADFDSRVHEASSRIEQRIAAYEQVMRGVDGLFARAGIVERNEFHDYIARLHLEENYPGIQGIRFAPIMPLAAKDRHIAAMRKQGLAGYTIYPEGRRDFYTPVIYVEPYDERNQLIFGYDTYSDLESPRPGDSGVGLRRTAMEQARDTGQAIISGKIRLLFETGSDKQAGFLMFLPIYRYDAPHGTLAERRANIIGWISSVFRMNDLMDGIFGERVTALDTDIYDGGEISDKTQMHDPDQGGGHDLNARFHSIRRLEVAGRTWVMKTGSLPGFESLLDKEKPQFIATAGIGASLLLALLIWLLMHGRIRALQAVRKISESEAKLQAILANVPTGIWLVGVDKRYRFVNKTFCDAVGAPESRFLAAQHLSDILGPEAAAACQKSDRACLEQEAPHLSHETLTFVDGKPHLLEITKVKLLDNMGEVIGAIGIATDITNKKKTEEIIWHQANFDMLTDLPNRRMFRNRLEQEIKKSCRTGLPIALLLIDLDLFKEINDTLGHDMGDLLLVEAARRILDCVRETDTVARLGGDEFTVLLSELGNIGNVDRIAQDINNKLAISFQLGEDEAFVSASIGITLYPNDATRIEDLLKNADQAMYAAKSAGRNRYSYFTPALQQAAQSRMRLTNDLRSALAASQFMVYYQPIVELATGHIHKAEALVRWQHPVRGLVSPAEFIPLAEETGMIVEIGDWVFREAVHQAKRLRALHHPEFQISVNKSPVQFRSQYASHKLWLCYLHEMGLPGASMVIEITEGLLLDDSAHVAEKLHAYSDAGIQISLDDFGTGYSSLSYLKKFDIDYLKIDQSFTRNLAPGSSDMVLSEAIIVMAHKLGMKVIAEGVETKQQRDLLAAAGCDYAQGYLFSRPVPAEEFEVLLKKGL